MSLPLSWVNKIFEKLAIVYGQAFLARWRDIDLALVKADWAHELGGFEQRAHAIAHALANLPTDSPPSVLQFRALCRRAPDPVTPRLAPPQIDPQIKESALAAVNRTLATAAQQRDRCFDDGKAWARRIVAAHEGGALVGHAAVAYARAALASSAPSRGQAAAEA